MSRSVTLCRVINPVSGPQEHTVVGLPDAPGPNDIQLSGLGIQPEHCRLLIEDGALHMVPIEGARCCVNGSQVTARTQLRHGDRLLWGNNHFFRVNCPRTGGECSFDGLASRDSETAATVG